MILTQERQRLTRCCDHRVQPASVHQIGGPLGASVPSPLIRSDQVLEDFPRKPEPEQTPPYLLTATPSLLMCTWDLIKAPAGTSLKCRLYCPKKRVSIKPRTLRHDPRKLTRWCGLSSSLGRFLLAWPVLPTCTLCKPTPESLPKVIP